MCVYEFRMKHLSLMKLSAFLDKELNLSEFPGDESVNGLQVEGKGSVSKIGVAVDACDYVFHKAAARGLDLLIVHHGLIWGGIRSVHGVMKKRIKTLLDADISLYACHLPLDWHPIYGNNSRLLKVLSIRRMGEFGEYHGKRIGYWGKLAGDLSLEQFAVHYATETLGVRAVGDMLQRKFGLRTEFIDHPSGL